ncbi:hypothetical protein LGK95_10575 [Clostridium algoriphilum]|uniref:hypothetical protein n=1 Tax=Clostridium algoriphilum TaxID=198347 RepID=UPI001CF3B2BD|nr:hypothetical protein [Clostridium algoriphilum]MCB2293963.1 hypothetical protein [Clostridium algoriphilum]
MDIFKLGQGILVFLGLTILILLIIGLLKLIKTLSSVNLIIKKNENNINEILSTLPKTFKNWFEITDNVKDVSEVVVKATASSLRSTESFQRYLVYMVDISHIIKNIFSTKR